MAVAALRAAGRAGQDKMMTNAAKSIFTWGILMVLFGAGYLFAPNFFLPLFGLSPTTEVWIRAFALLLTLLGGYYLYCAWNDDVIFFRVTIPGRLLFALGLAVFVALGLAKPILLLLGAVDTCGAIWTWQTLRNS
jgi:hypothetical protein